MTSTGIAPSSPDYYSGETSTLKILKHPSGAGLYVPLGQAYLCADTGIPDLVMTHPLAARTGVLLSPNVVVKRQAIETGLVATFAQVGHKDANMLYANLRAAGWVEIEATDVADYWALPLEQAAIDSAQDSFRCEFSMCRIHRQLDAFFIQKDSASTLALTCKMPAPLCNPIDDVLERSSAWEDVSITDILIPVVPRALGRGPKTGSVPEAATALLSVPYFYASRDALGALLNNVAELGEVQRIWELAGKVKTDLPSKYKRVVAAFTMENGKVVPYDANYQPYGCYPRASRSLNKANVIPVQATLFPVSYAGGHFLAITGDGASVYRIHVDGNAYRKARGVSVLPKSDADLQGEVSPGQQDSFWSAPLTTQPAPEPCSDLPRAGTPRVKTEGELTNKEFADVLFQFASETRRKKVYDTVFRELVEAGAEAYSKCELFTPAQPEVSQNRPADVDAAQAAFEAALTVISTRTSTPYVAGTFAFNV